MWLLRTGDYTDRKGDIELVQVWGNVVPDYAILSHRWSPIPDQEVSWADVRYLARSRHLSDDYDRKTIFGKPGFNKLLQAMKKAYSNDLGYIWIDTCCIDKDSSVELSEAINSMYRYYEKAQVCYAYLADVPQGLEGFEQSEYFQRGWTLQELLAPGRLIFTDSSWRDIGTRDELCAAVSRCTRISKDFLLKHTPIHHASIAERMSWAADRRLSREEDAAYSLLGIFGVNMYQLYGEGKQRAFQRLQEEILKQSEDQTIFAWTKASSAATTQAPSGTTTFDRSEYHGLLADDPSDFRHCGGMRTYAAVPDVLPPVMTAKGLRLSLPMTQKTNKLMVATLHSPVPGQVSGFFSLYLLKLDDRPNSYVRVCCNMNVSSAEPGRPQELYVVQNYDYIPREVYYPYHHLQIKKFRDFTPGSKETFPLLYSRRMGDLYNTAPGPRHWKVNKQVGKLTVALLVLTTRGRFEITFATTNGLDMTWAVTEPDGEIKMEPTTSGTPTVLQSNEVTVWIEEQIIDDAKWFIAMIDVKGRDVYSEEEYKVPTLVSRGRRLLGITSRGG